jgi:hypothetical protein
VAHASAKLFAHHMQITRETTHIFDCAPRPVRNPTRELPELWSAHCSCGWRSAWDALRVSDARADWSEHADAQR